MSKAKPFEERYWLRVDKRGPEECWLWKARSEQVWVTRTKSVSFRRIAWEIANGPHEDPDSRVHQTCGNVLCVNPKHLWRPTLAERFWAGVEKTDGCWNWVLSTRNKDVEYGCIRDREGKSQRTNRVSWELHFGPIPEGMIVCHKCDNPRCVRPDHLFLGTHKDNHDDMVRKGRQAKGPALSRVMREVYAKKKGVGT